MSSKRASVATSMKNLTGESHYFEESMNHVQVKKLLDNKTGSAGEAEKIEAMKWLIARISMGRDVSEFFPDVVKTVIVQSVELKKMAYMYLVHYADANKRCRDLALLSIASFQKDLNDQNQLIRTMALRVMTGIRVRDISQIQMIAVNQCVSDSSPLVRKTAALATAKLVHLDASLKDELIEVTRKLINDKHVMVVVSALAAFREVCPDRLDLLHVPYRTICRRLPDFDEWGQILAMEIMLRYARTQFNDPRPQRRQQAAAADTDTYAGPSSSPAASKRKPAASKVASLDAFYSSDEENGAAGRRRARKAGAGIEPGSDGSSDDSSDNDDHASASVPRAVRDHAAASAAAAGKKGMDEDLALLLRSSLPLLKSRNAGVVVAVAALHYYLGSGAESTSRMIGAALVHRLRGPRETRFAVLQTISQMAAARPYMFRDHLRAFFVHARDPIYTRVQKLDVLVHLADEACVSQLLAEMQHYCRDPDKVFVTAAVRAVGRIAANVPSVAERVLRGLMALVQSHHPTVVAETVVVIRQLLQQHPEHTDIMRRLARALPRTVVPAARASLVWMLGEFHQQLRTESPDALRLLAKSFSRESTLVKVQTLNLAVKLHLREPAHTTLRLLMDYVLELARFDLDYDLRDRARMLRNLLSGPEERLRRLAPTLLLASKPPPTTDTAIADGSTGAQPAAGGAGGEGEDGSAATGDSRVDAERFAVGSLSHLLSLAAPGYEPLPAWRTAAPETSLRDAPVERNPMFGRGAGGGRRRVSSSSDASSDGEGSFYSTSSSGSTSSDTDSSGTESDSDGSHSGSESDSHSDASSGGSSGSSGSSGSDGSRRRAGRQRRRRRSSRSQRSAANADAEDEEEEEGVAAAMDDVGRAFDAIGDGGYEDVEGGTRAGPAISSSADAELAKVTEQARPERLPLLNPINCGGLRVSAEFLREPSMYGEAYCAVKMHLANEGSDPLGDIAIRGGNLRSGQEVKEPATVQLLSPGGTTQAKAHIRFGASDTVKLAFDMAGTVHGAALRAPPGEVLRPRTISDEEFESISQRLAGMHTSKRTTKLDEPVSGVEAARRAVQALNAAPTVGSGASVHAEGDACSLRLAAQLPHSEEWVTVSVQALEAQGAASAQWAIDARCDDALRTDALVSAVAEALGGKASTTK